MTKQEVFHRVVEHLRTQGRPARIYNDSDTAAGPTCYYRAPFGCLKCAIGCLIPDEKYTPQMERQSVRAPVIMEAIGLGHDFIALLRSLQAAHDGWRAGIAGGEKMAVTLREIATNYNLNCPDICTSDFVW